MSTIKEWLGKSHGTFICCNFMKALKMKNPKKMCIYIYMCKSVDKISENVVLSCIYNGLQMCIYSWLQIPMNAHE